MRRPIVIDFETKKSFREAPLPKDLGISVAGVYYYATDALMAFEEHELSKMFPYFENASIIIGFNLDHFDMPVLQPYYPGDISKFKTFDILSDIKKLLGRRIGLGDIAHATLGTGKSGHGLQAIQFYREGRMDELKAYCLDDVKITKEVFDFGIQEGKIHYPYDISRGEKRALHVQWDRHMNYKGDDGVSLSLPF